MTPLLEMITQQSMDADYELVAAQHLRGHKPPQASRRHLGGIVIALLFGVLLAIAAVQTGRNAGVVSEGREQLISRIDERRQVVADQQSRIAELRASRSLEATNERELGHQLAEVEAERDTLAATAGWLPVTGSGVRVVVSDNAASGDGGLVHDSDLALLTDAFWQGGATAISVNGLRLTALSAFRNSADVIRLNGTSLSPPYVVVALGTTDDLRAGLDQSTAGKLFSSVVHSVGIGITMQNEGDLELPAASSRQLRLRYATAEDSPSRQPTKESEK